MYPISKNAAEVERHVSYNLTGDLLSVFLRETFDIG